MILAPDGGSDQQVERSNIGPPVDFAAFRQPLGMLIEHRVEDMNEDLVGRKETVSSADPQSSQKGL
jgi:hypothetical protein